MKKNTLTTYDEAVEYCKKHNLSFNALYNEDNVFMWHVRINTDSRFYASGHGESLLEAINDMKLSIGDFIIKTDAECNKLTDEARAYLDTNDFEK